MTNHYPVTLCARQPIFNRNLDVVAYELLFRNINSDYSSIHDGDVATAQLLINVFTEIAYENLLEGKRGFVNFTRNLLRSTPPVGSSEIVIEVLEDVQVDQSLIEDIKRLKEEKFVIALDDYVYQEAHHELLQLADIIKIDVLSQCYSKTKSDIEALQQYEVQLLAEKVETKRDYEHCRTMGFTLFQGYFLSRPSLVKGKKLDGNQQSVLRLLGVLQSDDTEFDEIERLISSNTTLTFKLLKLVNSAAFSFPRTINSLQEALTVLGLEKLRSWGTLLSLSELPSSPKILSSNALIRAEMCKRLSLNLTLDLDSNCLFTIGLLSTMEDFFGLSMESIVETLNLSAVVKEVLLSRAGNMGLLLTTSIAYERADFDGVPYLELENLGISSEVLQSTYQESIVWASEIMSEL